MFKFPCLILKNIFSKNVQIQSANEDEMSKFFISAKEKFKNRSLRGSSPECPLFNNIKYPLFIELLFKNPCPRKRHTRKS